MLYQTFADDRLKATKLFNQPEALFRWHSGGRGHAAILTTIPIDSDSHPLPTSPEDFFRALRRYGNFAWRRVGNYIEMAIVPDGRGWWIGQRGARIRALQDHLGLKIILVDGVSVAKITGLPSAVEDLIFAGYRDPHYGFAFTHGWVAPWVNVPQEYLRKEA